MCVGGEGGRGVTCGRTLYKTVTLSRAAWTTGRHAEPGACDRHGAPARTVSLLILYDTILTASFGGEMLRKPARQAQQMGQFPRSTGSPPLDHITTSNPLLGHELRRRFNSCLTVAKSGALVRQAAKHCVAQISSKWTPVLVSKGGSASKARLGHMRR